MRYPKYKDSGVEWLGEVPEHWTISRLGFLASKIGSGKTPSGGADNYQENGVLFIRSQNVYDDGLRLDDVVYISEDTDREMSMSRVQPGDILLNITGASLGRTCLVPDGFARANVNQHVCVIRLQTAVLRDFVGLVLKSAAAKSQLDYTQNGAAREGLNFKMVAGIACPLPPAEERNRIAAFLDHETAKIDALIAEQQRLVELLQEKRQAVISHAVTKGLNPDAPMKDSGIEWLGEVPEHWQVVRLGHRGRLQNGLSIGGEAFGAGDPFVSYGDVYNNTTIPDPPSGLVRSSAQDQSKCSLEAGDVLFTRTSETVDDIGVASTCLRSIPRSTFAGFLIRFRPHQGILDPGYSTYLFRNQGVQGHFAGTMNLVTRASLSQGELRNLPICIPPLEEQREIAAALDAQTHLLRGLVVEAERAITLLQERRSALISAAVTGQIDVRGFASSEAA